MHWFFFEFSPAYPYLSSALKFLLLGTLGEWLGGVLRTRGALRPFPAWMFLPKALIWAFLGVLVKWAFSSFVALVETQVQLQLLPTWMGHGNTLGFAFAVSLEMNLFFSPLLMFLHRLLDNLVARQWSWQGMTLPIYAIAWFWLPAHTITFLLPNEYRVLFAAALGICLGVILGVASRPKARSS